MPHQCVRCNRIYEDGAREILQGCSCGGKLFFYIKKEALDKSKETTIKLTEQERKQIEKDVFELVGHKNKDQPVVLDLESIRVLKPGKYELDLVHLFKKDPLVYRLEDGKYVIDLAETFKAELDKKNEK